MEKSVLIVEDNDSLRMLYSKVLEKAGYSVDSVASVEQAFTKIENKDYDLYIVDVVLGGVNSIQGDYLVEMNLRPMIVVTALDLGEMKTVKYLRKPFRNEELLEYAKELTNKAV